MGNPQGAQLLIRWVLRPRVSPLQLKRRDPPKESGGGNIPHFGGPRALWHCSFGHRTRGWLPSVLSAPVRVGRVWVTPPARMGEPPVVEIRSARGGGYGAQSLHRAQIRCISKQRMYQEGTMPQTALVYSPAACVARRLVHVRMLVNARVCCRAHACACVIRTVIT